MTAALPPHPLDLRRALDFILDDPEARGKLLVGGLLTLLPIANIAVVGYQVELARAVAAGRALSLPSWGDPGRYFVQGLGLSLARLIYAAPGLVLWGLPLAGLLALAFRAAAAGQWPPDFGALPRAYVAAALVSLALGALYALVVALLAPAVLAQYVRRGAVAACFDLRGLAAFIGRHGALYVRLWLTQWVEGTATTLVMFGVSLAVTALPCVGGLLRVFVVSILAFVSILLDGYLVGQFVRHE
jgi:hypothetical protein